ncbi:MAG: hypothetical protein WKF36_11450 [Candidatus Nitrosocosmicus sp.]
MPLAMDRSSSGIPIMLVVRKRKGYMATLAANPPNAPNIKVLTVGFLCAEKILLHFMTIAIRRPIGEIPGIRSVVVVVVVCLSVLLSTMYDTLFRI